MSEKKLTRFVHSYFLQTFLKRSLTLSYFELGKRKNVDATNQANLIVIDTTTNKKEQMEVHTKNSYL